MDERSTEFMLGDMNAKLNILLQKVDNLDYVPRNEFETLKQDVQTMKNKPIKAITMAAAIVGMMTGSGGLIIAIVKAMQH